MPWFSLSWFQSGPTCSTGVNPNSLPAASTPGFTVSK